MSRVLLTWELGLNLGHLARLLPIAKRLQAKGHATLVASRDLAAAASVLGAAGVPFVQSPTGSFHSLKEGWQPTGYADTLLSIGWGDRTALWGQVQAWVNLYKMFRPDLLVLDYSPTARLAARILQIPCVLIGNGFDLPPASDPLPHYPGFSWATREKAAQSERIALTNANAVLGAYKASPMQALCDLFEAEEKWLLTFPELDHYGARVDGRYAGPIDGPIDGCRISWPEGKERRVFAYLRPEMADLEAILGGLVKTEASIICYAAGVSAELLDRFRTPGIVFSSRPVDYTALFAETDVCFSYSALGTVTSFLLHGVPQLLAPRRVEGQLTARRVEDLGAGITLRGSQTASGVASMLDRLLCRRQYKEQALVFARKYAGFDPVRIADEVVVSIEAVLRKDRRAAA